MDMVSRMIGPVRLNIQKLHHKGRPLDAIGMGLAGLQAGADLDTPPLARGTTAPARLKELLIGVGARP